MILSKLRLTALAVLFALFFGALGAGTALAVQTHMLNAKHDLETALGELNAASNNKGGYRVNAIRLVNEAIQQVNLGIQYAQ